MYRSHLPLNDFRNYKQLDLSAGPGLYLFYGENAQGKTNLLEAVAMLATSNSFHAASDREIVNWEAPDHVGRITAAVERNSGDVKIEIIIIDPAAANGTPMMVPANRQRTRILISHVPKTPMYLVGLV